MKIYPLSEGSFTIDKTKDFIPFDTESEQLEDRSRGSLLVEIQPFAVQAGNDIIILDTGLGFSRNGKMQIHENLEKNSIDPLSVTIVLLSHLHKDHAGGIAIKDNAQLTFPNAVYYVHEEELQYAREKGKPSYDPSDFEILYNNPSLKTFSGENGNINENISFEKTGGHCPFHCVFWIQDDTEKVFFGADVAPQLAQMKRKVMAKYDTDGRRSMELREKWWAQAQEEKWTLLFFHDIHSGIHRF